MKDAFRVWKDGEKAQAIIIEAASMNDALDEAARVYGYIDYPDMAQEEAWSEDDGLNIEVPASESATGNPILFRWREDE